MERKAKKSGWQDSAAMEELAAKVELARMGVPIRVKEIAVSFLTGQSRKKLQADRQAGVGLPFIVVPCPTPKAGAKPRGAIFYNLQAVLDTLDAGDGGAA